MIKRTGFAETAQAALYYEVWESSAGGENAQVRGKSVRRERMGRRSGLPW